MMMLGGDKKKIATVIVGKLNGEMPVPPSAEEDASIGLEAAMQKFINCVHAKDPKGCVAALSDFMAMQSQAPAAEESGEI
jgi:hypothetical protein